MSAVAEVEPVPVVLTAHPLQRVGAFALAALAGKQHPDMVGEAELGLAVKRMEEDLYLTTKLADSKEEGGFWLGASYLFWPNSALNPTSRAKLSLADRRERLHEWRSLPGPEESIGVPCTLCGRLACGFFGKVDVPLAASTVHRNTTARGHDGLALCRGCLASFHALPYGCAVAGGRATAMHSWDERFMAKTITVRVRRMCRDATVAAGAFGVKRPYARQVAALQEIRDYEERFTAGIELIVFSNSNKEQMLDQHAMDQPLAEWLRRIRHDAGFGNGWHYLLCAHHGAVVPGRSALARNFFDQPRRVPSVAAAYLLRLVGDNRVPPGESPDLGALCSDYAIEVLGVNKSDADQIRDLAGSIAELVSEDGSQFMKYVTACRRTGDLQKWLKRQAISQVRFTRKPSAFIGEEQWRLLFDSDDAHLNRDLLLIGTLGKVHELGPEWRRDDPVARKDADDEVGPDNEELDT